MGCAFGVVCIIAITLPAGRFAILAFNWSFIAFHMTSSVDMCELWKLKSKAVSYHEPTGTAASARPPSGLPLAGDSCHSVFLLFVTFIFKANQQ